MTGLLASLLAAVARGELLGIEGIGPSKLDRYGDELLALLAPGDGG